MNKTTKQQTTKQVAKRIAKQLRKDVPALKGSISVIRLANLVRVALVETALPRDAEALCTEQLSQSAETRAQQKMHQSMTEAHELKHQADMIRREYERKTKEFDATQNEDKKLAEAVRTLIKAVMDIGSKGPGGSVPLSYLMTPRRDC